MWNFNTNFHYLYSSSLICFCLAPRRLYDKKVHCLSLVSNNQLLVMLCGRERIIRIKSLEYLLTHSQSALDSEIPETKNATLFATNPTSLILCVAIKNRLLLYKIHSNPRPYMYTLTEEINTTQNITCLEISMLKMKNSEDEILWYAHTSTLMVQKIGQQGPSTVFLKDSEPIFHERFIEILRVVPVTSD